MDTNLLTLKMSNKTITNSIHISKYILVYLFAFQVLTLDSIASFNHHLPKIIYFTHKSINLKKTTSKSKKSTVKKINNSKQQLPKTTKIYSPTEYINQLKDYDEANGIKLRTFHGPLNINLLDLDLNKVKIQPALSSQTFGHLATLSDIAKSHHALAAVNANYFKNSGIPLGTLIINNQWITGPIFNRIAIGIDNQANLFMNNTNFHATLYSSNPKIFKYWINNLNQPRRNGSRAIIYNNFWGKALELKANSLIITVAKNGEVTDITKSSKVKIPQNGYLICDRCNSPLNNLHIGDFLFCTYESYPTSWNTMKEAISGGPCLIKNGKLFLDLKAENFHNSWTSSKIDARTAIGYSSNNHLYIATIEGHHSLWDLAKFMKIIGVENALNLDGGGSTSMMLGNKVLTHHKNQRKIETALLVLPKDIQNN